MTALLATLIAVLEVVSADAAERACLRDLQRRAKVEAVVVVLEPGLHPDFLVPTDVRRLGP